METAAYDKTSEAILAGTGISFVLFIAFFWALFYGQKNSPKTAYSTAKTTYTYAIKNKDVPKAKEVLSSETENNPPSSYAIPFEARKQVFNLSCEFAAASSIIYHFTKDPAFSELNEKAAEKTLMEKIGVSQNPNIGIRMAASDSATLFENLNKKFGGSDFYGVHAPPFIDLFASYNLVAQPIGRGEEDKIKAIQQSVSLGRPVVAWIQIGYGNPIDVALSYDTTPIIKGEHVVVVHGYNENGVFVMDPGTGGFRYIPYGQFLTASSSFRVPFLSVYQGVPSDTNVPESIGVDAITGLNRSVVRIAVLNGSGKEADAEELIEILRDFGYTIVDTGNADSASYENVTLFYNSKIQDYIALLQKDLRLSMYNVSSVSAALDNDDKEDVVLIVGK